MLTEPQLGQTLPPRWWRGIAYLAVVLPFLFLLAFVWVRPDFNWQEPSDWTPVLSRAEASREKGDLYEARALYSQASRLAAWREDWAGLLAVACGMKKLDNRVDADFIIHSILVRAMMAAQSRQSRAGISAVARAFTATGEDKAASMVLSHVQSGWPEDQEQVGDGALTDCWRSESVDGRRASDAGR
ncbi:MAG: hypothetical protein HYY47_06320 [Deltaproteobacteria bacterium]|nr:hypothetical protein [Deltaproteobacteria bacterium]